MTSKRDKDLARDLEQLGYVYDRTNSKNKHFYIHEDTGCEVWIMDGCDERSARNTIRLATTQLGLPTKDNKRNPAQIRERNAAEHERAKRELEAARINFAMLAENDDRIREAEEAFLRAERKFRYWDRLMRGAA